MHALIAVGVNAEGYREILGIDVTTAEDGVGWMLTPGCWPPSAPPCPGRPGSAAAPTTRPTLWRSPRNHRGRGCAPCCTRSTTSPTRNPLLPNMIGSSTPWPTSSPKSPSTSRMPAQICWRSPPSLNRSGDRSGPTPLGEPQQRDPPANRRRRYLPRPRRAHPPGLCRAGPTTRRMDRIPPLPRPRRPQQITSRPQLTTRTGGTRPGGPNRLTMSRRITRQPVHHAHGLDPHPA